MDVTAALTAVVDRSFDATVVPGFTRLGLAVRSRLAHWTPVDSYDLTGRVVVVTGATSGLGLAATRALVGVGATVVVVGRDAAKAQRVRDELVGGTDVRGSVDVVVADVGDLDAVRAAADEILTRHPRLDVLVHNAGALDATRSLSPQGIEQTVASQVVGPFLLTDLLAPALARAEHGRVIWVSSGGMYSQPLAVTELEMPERSYDGTVAYARAKRAQVVLAELWADRLRGDGTVVHAMHPGWADTPGVARSLPTFRRLTGPLLRSPDEGADTIVWLAADDGEPLASTGRFWMDRRPRSTHRLGSTRRADTPAERAELWRWVAERAARRTRSGSGATP